MEWCWQVKIRKFIKEVSIINTNALYYLHNCLDMDFICCKEGIIEVSGRFISTSFSIKVGDIATLKEVNISKKDGILITLESNRYKYRLPLEEFIENFEIEGAVE